VTLIMTLVSPSLAHKPSKEMIVDQTKEVSREEGEDVRVKEVENLVQVDEEKGGGKGLLSGTTPPLWRFQSSCLSWPSQGCCGDRDCLDYSPAPRSLGLKEEQKGWTRGQISATTPDGRKVNQTCPSACS